MFEGIERFKSLKELIKNIETDSKQKVQMKPNDHGVFFESNINQFCKTTFFS